MQEIYPTMKIEIISMSLYQKHGESFSTLGEQFDLFEGIYASSWNGLCQFLELERKPVCCAVGKTNRFSTRKALTIEDLENQTVVMPMEGVSKELDSFRKHLKDKTKIIDSQRYDFDTFTLCEVNNYILITEPVYQDIHDNLITIPLKTQLTLPYGLMYANEPTPATKRFIYAIQTLTDKKGSDQSPII